MEGNKTEVIRIYLESGNSDYIQTIITIFIALLAGFVALYQVKSNTISAARITWIENLRDALSCYCMEVTKCGGVVSNMRDDVIGKSEKEKKEIIEKLYPRYEESTINCNKFACKVMLYLNSKEKKHALIEAKMEEIYIQLHVKKTSEFNAEKFNDDMNFIIDQAKLIFKTEWDKSKKIFRI